MAGAFASGSWSGLGFPFPSCRGAGRGGRGSSSPKGPPPGRVLTGAGHGPCFPLHPSQRWVGLSSPRNPGCRGAFRGPGRPCLALLRTCLQLFLPFGVELFSFLPPRPGSSLCPRHRGACHSRPPARHPPVTFLLGYSVVAREDGTVSNVLLLVLFCFGHRLLCLLRFRDRPPTRDDDSFPLCVPGVVPALRPRSDVQVPELIFGPHVDEGSGSCLVM